MTFRLTLLCVAATLAACAGSSHSSSGAPCGLTPGDTVFLKRGAVYRDCAVDQRAKMVTRVAPEFRSSAASGGACYSAELEFVVGTDGMPESDDAQVLRTNDPSFAAAVVAVLSRWHYNPGLVHGVPVRQIVKEKIAIASVIVAVPAGQTPRPPTHGPIC
jgi:hypothetical protein